MSVKGSESKSATAASCSICGRTAPAGTRHCSVSCTLADRVPLGDSALPATWELAGALVSAFVLFNQILFGFMAWAKERQGDEDLSGSFGIASIVVGAVWLLAAILAWTFSRPKRLPDLLGPFAGIAVVGLGSSLVDWPKQLPTQFIFVNLLIAWQLYRGFVCVYLASKKREK